MSSLEVNKFIGAVLLASMIAMISGLIAGGLVRSQPAEKVAVATPAVETGGQTATMTEEPVSPLLASADAKAGEEIAKRCATCHTFQKGEPAKVGPNLWGIVGNKHGHMEGFPYSKAIASIDKPWDYEQLNAFLASPKTYAPGTKMTFAGLKKLQERADVIAWLRTLSDSPVPLPAAGASSSDASGSSAASTAATGTTTAAPATTGEAATGTTEATGTNAAAATATGEQAAATASGTTQPPAPAATEAAGQTAEAATQQDASAAGTAPAPAGGESLAARLASADPAAGQKVAQRCVTCHTFDKDAPNKIGPNLWDIVGAKHGHREDFKYSTAMASIDKPWGYEELDTFLTAPQQYAPGTKMTFAGLKNAQDRANVIAYLRSLSDAPKPLP